MRLPNMRLHRWQHFSLVFPLLTLTLPIPHALFSFLTNPDQSEINSLPIISTPTADLLTLNPNSPSNQPPPPINLPDCIPWREGCPFDGGIPIRSQTYYHENTWTHKFEVCTRTNGQGEHCEPAIHVCTKNQETCVVCSAEYHVHPLICAGA